MLDGTDSPYIKERQEIVRVKGTGSAVRENWLNMRWWRTVLKMPPPFMWDENSSLGFKWCVLSSGPIFSSLSEHCLQTEYGVTLVFCLRGEKKSQEKFSIIFLPGRIYVWRQDSEPQKGRVSILPGTRVDLKGFTVLTFINIISNISISQLSWFIGLSLQWHCFTSSI